MKIVAIYDMISLLRTSADSSFHISFVIALSKTSDWGNLGVSSLTMYNLNTIAALSYQSPRQEQCFRNGIFEINNIIKHTGIQACMYVYSCHNMNVSDLARTV